MKVRRWPYVLAEGIARLETMLSLLLSCVSRKFSSSTAQGIAVVEWGGEDSEGCVRVDLDA